MERKIVIELKCAIDEINFGFTAPETDSFEIIEDDISNAKEAAAALGVSDNLIRTLADFALVVREKLREDFESLEHRINFLEEEIERIRNVQPQ